MKEITDEMIMDLADGNLSDDQAKKVIKFLKTSSAARKKYEAFVKTSADFSELNPKNDSIEELPSNIQTLINKSRSKTEQKFKPKGFSFLDNFKNFLTNFGAIRNSLVVATASLMIGIFGTNVYLNQNNLVLRNQQTTVEYNQYFNINIYSKGQNVILGQTVEKFSPLEIEIFPLKEGKFKLFHNDEEILKKQTDKNLSPLKNIKIIPSNEIFNFIIYYETQDTFEKFEFNFVTD
tara:strand:- start:980 stop:1684 length:705 start_codon:yes stop_codon:yes gene_type:complete